MKTMRPGVLGLALLCALLGLAPLAPVQAQTISCSTLNMTNVNFGNVDLVNGTGMSTTATLTYSCKATNNSGNTANVCFSVSYSDPRQMSGTSPLVYQLRSGTSSGAIWGSAWATEAPVSIAIAGNSTVSGTLTMAADIAPGQTVPPGSESDSYAGIATAITYKLNGSCAKSTTYISGTYVFPFSVNATVVKACKASAVSAIDLGSAPASAANIDANGNISITCSNTTPYYVGLQPSNGNSAGAGVMSAPVGNSDKVPYQLYQNAGMSTLWGNTATAVGAGNGIAGMGNGTAKSHTVYVRAPSADYRPDSYSDTVTVVVNY